MIDLSLYFRNPFSDNTISDENLKKFTEDHMNMMTLNNESGQFSTTISETVAAYNAYFGQSADKNTTMDVHTQLNQSIRTIFEEFITLVTREEPQIRAVWGQNSAEYKEFYPDGLAEYNNATIVNAEKFMTRFANAVNNHMHELGQDFLNLFNGIKTNFLSARESQTQNISGQNLKSDLTSGRDALEKQLMKNMLTFALAFMDLPEKGLEFFNTNLLLRPDEGPAKVPAQGGAIEQKEPLK